MKKLRLYNTYEHANDAQITLLAADIDAKVEFEHGSSVEDKSGGYALLVDVEQHAQAEGLLAPCAVEGHESLLRCPACKSEHVVERDAPWWGVFLLGVPIVIYVADLKMFGRTFRCADCRCRFRKKP